MSDMSDMSDKTTGGRGGGVARVVQGTALGGALGIVGGLSAALFTSVVLGLTDLGGGLGDAAGAILVYALLGTVYGGPLGCVLGAVIGLLLGALRAERHAPVVSALFGVLFVVGVTGELAVGIAVVAVGYGAIGWAVGTGFARASVRRPPQAPAPEFHATETFPVQH